MGVVAAAQLLASWLELGPPVQPLLPIVFALTVPGFVLLDLDHPTDRVARLMLGVAASLATNVVLVTVLLLGDPIWIAPSLGVALIGVWRLVRFNLAGRLDSVESAIDDFELVGDIAVEEAEPAIEAEVPAAAVRIRSDLGVSWKRRDRLGEVLDQRPKRPFEKPIRPPEQPVETMASTEPHSRTPSSGVPGDEPRDRDPMRPSEEVASPDWPTSKEAEAWRQTRRERTPDRLDDRSPAAGPLEEIVEWRDAPIARESAGLVNSESMSGAAPADGSSESEQSVKVPAPSVDLNSADINELATLPGVGPRLAARLVQNREARGPFRSLVDLERVSGFGPAKVAGMEGIVSFDEQHPVESSEKETS